MKKIYVKPSMAVKIFETADLTNVDVLSRATQNGVVTSDQKINGLTKIDTSKLKW
jgi:hypothetical protein